MRTLWLIVISCFTLLAGCTNHDRRKETLEKLDSELRKQEEIIKAQTLYETVKYVRIKFGEQDADTYLRCKTSPPTEKKNQDKCARLDAKVKQARATPSEKW